MLTGVSQCFSPLQDTQWKAPHRINAISSEAVPTGCRPEVQLGPVDSNAPLPSSLPESAILDILSALNHLAEFSQLLAIVNEQGQTLLHPSLISRVSPETNQLGNRPNVRDVNGFTALYAAYLCDDPFVADILRARGSTPFVLDELGRSPAAVTTTIPSASEILTRKYQEVPPLAVGNVSQV